VQDKTITAHNHKLIMLGRCDQKSDTDDINASTVTVTEIA